MSKKRAMSFKYASDGIVTALKEEPNLILHFLAGAIAIALGFFFQITQTEWSLLIILIGLVIAIELTNTAIEEVVDSFTQDVHPSAKKAKDVAAGAVLIASITAFIVGLLIFLPYIVNLIR